MMITVALIISCITTSEKRKIGKIKSGETENGTLVTLKRERVLHIIGVNIPLEKIISKKGS